MAILVTGGAGFIGSHTCAQLLNAGNDILIYDNFSNSKPEAVRRIETITGKPAPVIEADIRDEDALRCVFARHKIEAVIHFAGQKAVGESVQKPLDYYYNNVTGTITLCRVMAQAGCKSIVFSSSATVYGMNPDIPYKETHPLLPATSPYGATKSMIETILKDIAAADEAWSLVLLRYFNPIGAHPSGQIGENPNGIPNNLMPYICQVAAGKLPHLNIFGDDYATPDGTGVRDFLHVVDLAAGHLCALDYIRSHRGVQAVNLGTGCGNSVLDVVHTFEQVNHIRVPYKIAPRRPGDIAMFYADPTKARQLFGWEAQYTLADMCRDSWNFIQQNPNGL